MSKTVALVSYQVQENGYYDNGIQFVDYINNDFFVNVSDEDYNILRWNIPNGKVLLVYEERELIINTVEKLLAINRKEKAAEEKRKADYIAKKKEREDNKKQRAIIKAQKLLQEAGL